MRETKTGGVPQQKTDIVPSPMMIKTFFINGEKARLYPIIFNNFRNLRVGGGTTGGEHADSSHEDDQSRRSSLKSGSTNPRRSTAEKGPTGSARPRSTTFVISTNKRLFVDIRKRRGGGKTPRDNSAEETDEVEGKRIGKNLLMKTSARVGVDAELKKK